MLVKCPECGVRYEIDGSLIPPEGRRVQCTSCEHVWRQDPGGGDTAMPGEGLQRQSKPLADDVRAILREEAEREARVRREKGLVDIANEATPAREAAARLRPHGAVGPLPDADAINATLRAASERAADARGLNARPGRGGFLTGLVAGLALVGLGALLYAEAPRFAEAVPAAAPALERYAEGVDDLRFGLDRAAERAAATVSGLLPAED
jgi:predicted Zn finger-like uncharacterized protein